MKYQLPWQHKSLKEWSIVGMNHYHIKGKNYLFVAMTKGGICITEEGVDDNSLWDKIKKKAKQ